MVGLLSIDSERQYSSPPTKLFNPTLLEELEGSNCCIASFIDCHYAESKN